MHKFSVKIYRNVALEGANVYKFTKDSISG